MAEDPVKVAVPQRGTWETSVADMGEQAKIFAKHGIKVESLYTSGGGETMQALISGSVDVALATGAAAMFACLCEGRASEADRDLGNRRSRSFLVREGRLADQIAEGCRRQDHGVLGDRLIVESCHAQNHQAVRHRHQGFATGAPPATFTQTMTGQIDIGWSAARSG